MSPSKANQFTGYAYLLGLDSTNFSTNTKSFLRDPAQSPCQRPPTMALRFPNESPPAPVFSSRHPCQHRTTALCGLLLHFSADLQTQKTFRRVFGWDYKTPPPPRPRQHGLPPTKPVPPLLLLPQIQQYASADGYAINRSPCSIQTRPRTESPAQLQLLHHKMRESFLLSVCNSDPDTSLHQNPRAFRGSRMVASNTAAVNPRH